MLRLVPILDFVYPWVFIFTVFNGLWGWDGWMDGWKSRWWSVSGKMRRLCCIAGRGGWEWKKDDVLYER